MRTGKHKDCEGVRIGLTPLTAWLLKVRRHDMKKYDLSKIMLGAWRLYRKEALSFAECLHRAWISAKAADLNEARIAKAKAAAGITEQIATWAEWKKAGYEVIHGSKALFGCDLIWGSKGDGAVYKARFFGESQVQALA